MTAVAADDDTAAAEGAVDVCFTLEVRLAGAVARSNEGARRLEAYNGTVSDWRPLSPRTSFPRFRRQIFIDSRQCLGRNGECDSSFNQTTSINTTLANSDVRRHWY